MGRTVLGTAAALLLALAGCGPAEAEDEAAGVSSALWGGHGGSSHGKGHAKHDGKHHGKDKGHGGCDDRDKVEICHVTGKPGHVIRIEVDPHAVPAHLAHGDWLAVDGRCDGGPSADVVEPPEEDAWEPPEEDVPPPPEDPGEPPCEGKCGDEGPPPEPDAGPATDAGPAPDDGAPGPDVPPPCPPGQNCETPA